MGLNTLVLGASEKPDRYAYRAIGMLTANGHPVLAVSASSGSAFGVVFHTSIPRGYSPDTITMYLRPELQKQYEEEILQMKPRRIIFNPGTENHDLAQLATAHGILVQEACTLVLLSTLQYEL